MTANSNTAKQTILETDAVKDILIAYANAHKEIFGETITRDDIEFCPYFSNQSWYRLGVYALVKGRLIPGAQLRRMIADDRHADPERVKLVSFTKGNIRIGVSQPLIPH